MGRESPSGSRDPRDSRIAGTSLADLHEPSARFEQCQGSTDVVIVASSRRDKGLVWPVRFTVVSKHSFFQVFNGIQQTATSMNKAIHKSISFKHIFQCIPMRTCE
jgi:hypothetical protein